MMNAMHEMRSRRLASKRPAGWWIASGSGDRHPRARPRTVLLRWSPAPPL